MKISELISELKNVCPDFDVVVVDDNFDSYDIESIKEEDNEVTINIMAIY